MAFTSFLDEREGVATRDYPRPPDWCRMLGYEIYSYVYVCCPLRS